MSPPAFSFSNTLHQENFYSVIANSSQWTSLFCATPDHAFYPLKLTIFIMASPSSSSTESSSPPRNSSTTLPNFDPFAVHPFTNCSQVPKTNAPRNPLYGYVYGPSNGNYSGASQPPSTIKPAASSRSTTSTYTYAQRPGGIFEPFRKDTSSPELDDVLKKGAKVPNPPPTTSSVAKPIPISRK